MDIEKLKKLVIYNTYIDHCVTRIKDNVSAYDPKTDEKAEHWVYEQLESGNPWAWCDVTVKAHFGGLTGSDRLGDCSYKSQQDFEEGSYYGEMRITAFMDLATQIKRLIEAMTVIVKDDTEKDDKQYKFKGV